MLKKMVFYFDFHIDHHHRGLITVKSFFLGNTKRYTPSNTVVTYCAVSCFILPSNRFVVARYVVVIENMVSLQESARHLWSTDGTDRILLLVERSSKMLWSSEKFIQRGNQKG
ncbi:unnamed protein product [Clavelina lepadiformis]|uniref:Uncharacterized protein n=1 Tax=Clavelina lepadiformis TaxID=159417 RepID=A0ABP0FI65_CLALP